VRKEIRIAIMLIFLLQGFFCCGKALASKKDYAVVLHGIARSSSHMKELVQYLSEDFEVINVDYPSTDYEIDKLADFVFDEKLAKIDKNRKINFVGYSMGGLVVRALLNKHKYKNIGRVVFLATPNKGSEVADFLKNNWLYKKIYGPAGQQLTTKQTIEKILGIPYYEFGVIAGNFSIDPISSSLIDGENDGKVAVEKTKIDGMKDFVLVDASHTFFPSNKKVKVQTLAFLKNGQFKH